MRIFSIIIIAAALFVTSCKNDSSSASDSAANADSHSHESHDHAGHDHDHDHDHGSQKTAITPTGEVKQKSDDGTTTVYAEGSAKLKEIPDPCSFMTTEWIQQNVMYAKGQEISIKGTNDTGDKGYKSCFFRWNMEKKKNAGVMIQIMNNPLPDEVENWPEIFIQSKLTEGENKLQGEERLVYKRMSDLGDEGVYSYEAGKYYWRVANDYLFLVATNLDVQPVQQKEIAVTIGKHIMNTFKN